ncbi:hypothetical protein RvY_03098 [Ramazzottius varieornatus]|uniref:Uncharacterized protein n=1 Tax=Ramazzottius varieornatus TaxID=947166 RepID=A0A1D1UQC6_RAMVA|nr:hypothetical protein RvY_03098 [Ramazzottius varieornatus]
MLAQDFACGFAWSKQHNAIFLICGVVTKHFDRTTIHRPFHHRNLAPPKNKRYSYSDQRYSPVALNPYEERGLTSSTSILCTVKFCRRRCYCNKIKILLRNLELPIKSTTRKTNCVEMKDFVGRCGQKEVYAHNCGDQGKLRGCPHLSITDGVWKSEHRYCAMELDVGELNFD